MGLDSFMAGGAKKTTKKTTKKTSEPDKDMPVDNLQKAQAYVEKAKKTEEPKIVEVKVRPEQVIKPATEVESQKKQKITNEKKKIAESKNEEDIEQDINTIDSTEGDLKDEMQHNMDSDSQEPSIYSLVSVTLSCSAKCGYKKQMKRPKSFTPKDKDLFCPKCGEQMKIQKK
jgi:rRNA maturation protein Nop10